MKHIFMATAAVLALAGTTQAETLLPLPINGALEYAVEAETTSIDLGTMLVTGQFAVAPTVSLSDTTGSFDLDTMDLTVTYMVGQNVDVYANVEGDKDFNHNETTVGLAFSF